MNVGDLVEASGLRAHVLICPQNELGVIVEIMDDKWYLASGRTVRVYWQKSKTYGTVRPDLIKKIVDKK